MSRPSSRKGSKKGSAKSPKKQIQELTELNQQLTDEIAALQIANNDLKENIVLVSEKLAAGIDKKDFDIKQYENYLDIPQAVLTEMIDNLIIKKKIHETSVESRVEELETRVTEMSMENAKLRKKTIAYEMGFQNLLQSHNMEDLKDKIYQLQLIAGKTVKLFSWQI